MPLLLKLYLHEISGGKKGQSKEVYLINFILFLFICLLTSSLSILYKECDINRILINQEVIMTIYLANYTTIETWMKYFQSLSLPLSLSITAFWVPWINLQQYVLTFFTNSKHCRLVFVSVCSQLASFNNVVSL